MVREAYHMLESSCAVGLRSIDSHLNAGLDIVSLGDVFDTDVRNATLVLQLPLEQLNESSQTLRPEVRKEIDLAL